MGLRGRLILIVTFGSGLSLLLSLIVIVRLDYRAEVERMTQRAAALLSTLSVPSAFLLTQGRLPDLDNLMDELAARKDALDLDALMLVDHEGRILAHTDPERFGQMATEGDEFVKRALAAPVTSIEWVDGRVNRVAVPVQTGLRWGTLFGVVSQSALRHHVNSRRARLVISAIAMSSIGLTTLLIILSLYVVAPLREVGRAAQRFADGDLSARAPVLGGDEIAVLAGALNTAAKRLSNTTAELEEQVRVRTAELQAANRELQEANARLETLAITDGLTRLYNHRHFHELLAREVERQQRKRAPFSLLMLDVDHFKNYNDTHGHQAGDEVLRAMAKILRENTRTADTVARYGGEEFIVMLLEADHDSALMRAEKLRAQIAAYPFAHHQDQPLGCVSVSIGVATWPDHGADPKALVRAADRALYLSKDRGRNKVSSAQELT